MTSRATIVDYGSGNLRSIARGIEQSGGEAKLTDDPDLVAGAERLVLPGVGAFGKTMEQLRERGLVEPILRFAGTGRPFLGVCIGMQLMLDYSEEFGRHEGLSLIPGRVSAISGTAADGTRQPVPHIGWAVLEQPNWGSRHGLFADVKKGDAVYFVHSFTAVPESADHIAATIDYGGRSIVAAIARDNLVGCQFHPEKSGPVGLGIIKNFVNS
jgi:imidazole glycerol-phosphate synthase subunit HisH